jgi:hypothetical protein
MSSFNIYGKFWISSDYPYETPNCSSSQHLENFRGTHFILRDRLTSYGMPELASAGTGDAGFGKIREFSHFLKIGL